MSRRVARFFQSLALALCIAAPLAHADTLALPPNLTDLSSEEGQKFFLESGSFTAYFPIADNFVTQKTQSYCGVASIVMVLNALGVPAPTTPDYQPYHTFTQDNLLDDMTDAVLPRAVLARQGMTLDQLGKLIALHPVALEVHHAGDSKSRRLPRRGARLSELQGSFCAGELPAQGNRPADRRSYFTARGLRRQG